MSMTLIGGGISSQTRARPLQPNRDAKLMQRMSKGHRSGSVFTPETTSAPITPNNKKRKDAKSARSEGNGGDLVRSVHVLHSPEAAPAKRAEQMALLEARLLPLTGEGVTRVLAHEPSEMATRASELADLGTEHAGNPTTGARPWPHPACDAALEAFRGMVRQISVRQLSNAMKHRDAMVGIAAEKGDAGPRFALVVEDDALCNDTLTTALSAATHYAPADADLVFLGLPSPLRPPNVGGAVFDVTLERFSALPAVESYLVTPAAAERLAAAFLPVRFATHLHLTYLVRLLGLRVYHAVPNVFVDGSKVGALTSTLDSNNRLLWCQGYCQAEALVREKGAALSMEELGPLLAAVPDPNHPDVHALRAAAWVAKGRPREAQASFSQAYEGYERDRCPMDISSLFLKAYMAVHRDLQDDLDTEQPAEHERRN